MRSLISIHIFISHDFEAQDSSALKGRGAFLGEDRQSVWGSGPGDCGCGTAWWKHPDRRAELQQRRETAARPPSTGVQTAGALAPLSGTPPRQRAEGTSSVPGRSAAFVSPHCRLCFPCSSAWSGDRCAIFSAGSLNGLRLLKSHSQRVQLMGW